MKKRTTLNKDLLGQVKKAFQAMPGGADPVAGAGMMTDAMGAPMGGGMPGEPMPPEGMPMDPAMGGMPPMDPGMMDPGMPEGGQVSMSSEEFKDLLITMIVTLSGGKMPKPAKEKGEEGGADPVAALGGNSTDSKLDQIIELLSSQQAPPMDGGMPPPMDPGMQGMPGPPMM